MITSAEEVADRWVDFFISTWLIEGPEILLVV